MTGAGRRFELDLFAMALSWAPSLERSPRGAQFGQDGFDAVLVDQAQAGVGNAQADPAVLAFDPEAAVLQIRQEAALGLVVGVGNIVAHHRGFSRHLADSSHDRYSRIR